MFAFGLYAIAAISVLATLLREQDYVLGIITFGMIACGLGLRFVPERTNRTHLSLAIGGALSVMTLLAVRMSGLGWGPGLIATAFVILAVLFAAGHVGSLQAVIAGTIPSAAIVLALLLKDEGPSSWIPVDILLWSLAAWPVLALLSNGRRWALTSSIGVVGLLLVIQRLMAESNTAALTFIDLASEDFTVVDTSRREGLLAISQTILVILSIAPYLVRSGKRWRWLAALGTLLVVGPLVLVVLTGPWLQGWPTLLWWFVIPGISAFGVGFIGMLCTTRQPEQLAENAIRTMALGIGATATLVLPLIAQTMPAEALLPQLTQAVSPLAWGLGLALVLSMTGLVARRNDPGFSTSTLFRMQVRPRFRASLLNFSYHVSADLREETKRWWSPQGVVPVVVLAATWPAFHSLGSSAMVVPLLAGIAVLINSLAQHALPLWTALIALLLWASGMCLGLDMASSIAAAAVGLAVSWPFVRWQSLNTAWTFCAGLLVHALLWNAFTPFDTSLTDRHMVVAIALGVSVLVTNALAPGGVRWLVLACTAVWLLVFLARWLPSQDPYFPLLLQGQQLMGELGHLLLRFPLMALVLTTLWISRHRVSQAAWRISARERILLASIGVAAAMTWALDPPAELLVGMAAWLGLIVVAKPVWNELYDQTDVNNREPLIDALSFVVAILIISAGHATALAREATSAGNGLLEPGAMGGVLIEAIRDLVALLATLGALLVIHVLGYRDRIMAKGQVLVELATNVYHATASMVKRKPEEGGEDEEGAGATPAPS